MLPTRGHSPQAIVTFTLRRSSSNALMRTSSCGASRKERRRNRKASHRMPPTDHGLPACMRSLSGYFHSLQPCLNQCINYRPYFADSPARGGMPSHGRTQLPLASPACSHACAKIYDFPAGLTIPTSDPWCGKITWLKGCAKAALTLQHLSLALKAALLLCLLK